MWSKKLIWLVWFLLYLCVRLCGVLPFSYNFRLSRFEPSLLAFIYSWMVLLAFCAFHPTYVSLYLSRIVTVYDDYIIYQLSTYWFKFGRVAFVLFYLQQIFRRRDLIKFLNDGLEMRALSSNLPVGNKSILTFVLASIVVNLFFVSLMLLNQNYLLAEDEQDELFVISAIAVFPFFALSFFGLFSILLTSLIVLVNTKINRKINWMLATGNIDSQVLKHLSILYYKIYDMTCQISRLSSFIITANQVKSFIGTVCMLYYMPSQITKNIAAQVTFQPEFFVELTCNFMVSSYWITQAVIGFMIISVSRETALLVHGLKSNDGRKEVIELALFMVHNRVEMRVFDMVTVNLESFFMAVTIIIGYVVFLVQYRVTTEE